MEQKESNNYTVPLAIIVAGAMIAGSIYLGGVMSPRQDAKSNADEVNIDMPEITVEDHIIGSRNAEVIIVEYSDTQCPFCKNFHNTMKQIISEYEGKVAWVYRHFPIPSLHKLAMKEAEATECAKELGGNQVFWKYLDLIFEKTKSSDGLDPAELPKIASEVGLDVDVFNSCLNSGKYVEKIENGIREAVKAGVRGTPYSFLVTKDGKKIVINGAQPIESLRLKIDNALN